MEKSSFHKSLMTSKKGAVTEDKIIAFIVVGAMVGIGVPILFGFFAGWTEILAPDMPVWLITAGPAFLGLGVLIIVVSLARSKK